jgi:uncharacterized membrane protein YbhN (UPF0104 family)
MLPVTPGNLGVYEGAAFLAYRWAGVDAEDALALAVLQHLVMLAGTAGPGWAVVTIRALRTGERAPSPAA